MNKAEKIKAAAENHAQYFYDDWAAECSFTQGAKDVGQFIELLEKAPSNASLGEEIKVLKMSLSIVDELLAAQEDVAHGIEGHDITVARGIIQKALNNK